MPKLTKRVLLKAIQERSDWQHPHTAASLLSQFPQSHPELLHFLQKLYADGQIAKVWSLTQSCFVYRSRLGERPVRRRKEGSDESL